MMMKIDLHCHTLNTKSGESTKRKVDAAKFIETISDANVKMVAITNHNFFDINQFEEFHRKANNKFILVPGVELDVKGINGEKGHMIIVCDYQERNQLYDFVEKSRINYSFDDYYIDIQNLLEETRNINCMYINHFLKSPHLSSETLEYILKNVREEYKVFLEPSNLKSLGVIINHGYRGILGSDVQDWDNYDSSKLPFLKLNVDNFKQLLLLAKKDTAIVESLLNKKTKHTLKIEVSKKKIIEHIYLYDDINIIYGGKGSGKSEYLRAIKKAFIDKGLKISYFDSDNSKDELKNKISVKDLKRDLSLFGEQDDFDMNVISNWVEHQPTLISYYSDYVNTKNQNINKMYLKATEIKHIINNSKSEAQNYLSKSEYFSDIQDKIIKMEEKYLLEKENTAKLIELLANLAKHNYSKAKMEWINYTSKEFTNHYIRNIKKFADQKSNTRSIPNETGLFRLWKKRVDVKKEIDKYLLYVKCTPNISKKYIGDLGLNKKLYTETQFRFLCADSITKEFDKNITDLRKINKYFIDISSKYFSYGDFIDLINKIKNISSERDIKSITDFIGISKKFTNEANNDYEPSSGECKMVYLNEKLNDEADIYIIDEPEKSLGNKYINDDVVPVLNNLAAQSKVIIIATHSANIAVRTLPYTSILKEYDNGKFLTYIGNPFTNSLININDKNFAKDWKETSISILEGGRQAFEERGDSYNG